MPAEPADAALPPGFRELQLPEPLLAALDDVGYEAPSPIQAATIPLLLAGRDVLGQAQTGTGKTAAFALPLLARIDVARRVPQVLVLTPTRELALQVAEACQRYARHLPGFHALAVYGGQAYPVQIRSLRRGVHLVVGTPGRIIDHVRRGTLDLGGLASIVLDEADEMLRMGFVDDVSWILEQTPPHRQVVLFSATMPASIRQIAQRHMRDPAEVSMQQRTAAAANIRQRYWVVDGTHKLDALSRLLEVEDADAVLVFVRTKTATVELAEKLSARGHEAAALHGDMPQAARERTIRLLKEGQIGILVATDVAARGLDVERISHVINYDVPYDTEAYIHRIGRTGRFGRTGEAILFVAPRERRMLRAFERSTGKSLEVLRLPTTDDVNQQRIARFRQKILDVIEGQDLAFFSELVSGFALEHKVAYLHAAAALAFLAQGGQPLLLPVRPDRPARDRGPGHDAPAERPARTGGQGAEGTRRYRIEVGKAHGVKPGQIVGAIANEAGLEGRQIGRIDIRHAHSLVDLPEDLPREVLAHLAGVRVCRRPLRIAPLED